MLDVANRVQPDTFDALLTALLAKRSDLRAVLDGEQGCAAAEALLRRNLALADGLTRDGLRGGLAFDRDAYRRVAAAVLQGGKTEKDWGARLHALCERSDAAFIDLKDIILTAKFEVHKRLLTNGTKSNHRGWRSLLQVNSYGS